MSRNEELLLSAMMRDLPGKQQRAAHLVSEKDTRPTWQSDQRSFATPFGLNGYTGKPEFMNPSLLGGGGFNTLKDILSHQPVSRERTYATTSDLAGLPMTGSLAGAMPAILSRGAAGGSMAASGFVPPKPPGTVLPFPGRQQAPGQSLPSGIADASATAGQRPSLPFGEVVQLPGAVPAPPPRISAYDQAVKDHKSQAAMPREADVLQMPQRSPSAHGEPIPGGTVARMADALPSGNAHHPYGREFEVAVRDAAAHAPKDEQQGAITTASKDFLGHMSSRYGLDVMADTRVTADQFANTMIALSRGLGSLKPPNPPNVRRDDGYALNLGHGFDKINKTRGLDDERFVNLPPNVTADQIHDFFRARFRNDFPGDGYVNPPLSALYPAANGAMRPGPTMERAQQDKDQEWWRQWSRGNGA